MMTISGSTPERPAVAESSPSASPALVAEPAAAKATTAAKPPALNHRINIPLQSRAEIPATWPRFPCNLARAREYPEQYREIRPIDPVKSSRSLTVPAVAQVAVAWLGV